MITAKEYAKIHEVHYTTVMNWLRSDLVPGAVKENLPFGGFFYKIPANAPKPDLTPGPKKQAGDGGEVSTATEAPDDGAPGAAIGDDTPVKPPKRARKKGSDL